jgi:hypothetical protein
MFCFVFARKRKRRFGLGMMKKRIRLEDLPVNNKTHKQGED